MPGFFAEIAPLAFAYLGTAYILTLLTFASLASFMFYSLGGDAA